MQLSQIPAKFNIPFANNAGGSFINPIPQASQTSITPGAASLFDGFPPLNFQPTASGGIPPFGKDFNGILNQSTAWDRWFSAGGPIYYDATFQSAVGGYPNGAIVQSLIVPGNFWMSTVDNNTTNPDAGGSGWVSDPGRMGTGDWKHRPDSTPQPGYVISNGTTIGSAASAATQRANADTQLLYQYLWSTYSNTQCPVSGGRGANSLADFNANKTIGTLDLRSTGVMGVDQMGAASGNGLLNNVPVQFGSATVAGSILGENLHQLIVAELAAFTPSGSVSSSAGGLIGTTTQQYAVQGGNPAALAGATGISISSTFSGNSIGSNTPHNTVQRSILVYWFHKL
jgi:hypothetical protein